MEFTKLKNIITTMTKEAASNADLPTLVCVGKQGPSQG